MDRGESNGVGVFDRRDEALVKLFVCRLYASDEILRLVQEDT